MEKRNHIGMIRISKDLKRLVIKAADMSYPIKVRPLFYAGTPDYVEVYNEEELEIAIQNALDTSPINEVALECN